MWHLLWASVSNETRTWPMDMYLVPLQVAVVFLSQVGRHQQLDVVANNLLLAVTKCTGRRLVVPLDDSHFIDLQETIGAKHCPSIALFATKTAIGVW